jgi:hypothetical protein
MRAANPPVTDVTVPTAHFRHPLPDVLELARIFPNENGADGIHVGNRVLYRTHFQQSGICIRYAAILLVHDLETRAIHLR